VRLVFVHGVHCRAEFRLVFVHGVQSRV